MARNSSNERSSSGCIIRLVAVVVTILLTTVVDVEVVPVAVVDVEVANAGAVSCDCVTKTDGNKGFGISAADVVGCVGSGGG